MAFAPRGDGWRDPLLDAIMLTSHAGMLPRVITLSLLRSIEL